ncbi:MAG: hypothetical protein RRZ24_10280 [Clostridia bacterium]
MATRTSIRMPNNPALKTKPVNTGFNVLKDMVTGRQNSNQSGNEPAPPAVDHAALLQGLTKQMYQTTFRPEPIQFDPLSEDELKSQISGWLRPSYDQAILDRQKHTVLTRAELDADAISRGMGASTYVTDVKNRQLRSEAQDIALLETNYGSVLAKNLQERLSAQQDRKMEVDQFNREQEAAAYRLAYDAAKVLFSGYLSSGASKRGGGSGRKSGSSSSGGVTSAANCDAFLSSLSGTERAAIYAGTSSQATAYRSEILASVGSGGFYQLQHKYPSFP